MFAIASHSAADVTGSIAQTGPAEFAALVQQFLPQMVRLAERLGGTTNRDDIVQEALINAWTKRSQFNPDRGHLGGWLMAIVADQARKSWRRRFVVFGTLERPPVANSDDRVDVASAVGQLPARQRLAVDCFYFAGLSVAQTALVMRCSEGTVKSTLSDARANLRPALEIDE